MTTTKPAAGGTQSASVKSLHQRWVASASRRLPLAISRASGAMLFDCDGRGVVDLTSGWNVANTGWSHPAIVKGVQEQAARLAFAPAWCATKERPAVAERLGSLLDDNVMVVCGCSGSEAVELALKVARRATARHTVVGFAEAYHGSTLGAMLAGGVSSLHGIDLPLDLWHRHIPLPDPLRSTSDTYTNAAVAAITASPAPAAVLLEVVFTNPGVIIGDASFYLALERAARSVGALVIVDEIGTGFGRTGTMFALQQFPIRPDIVVVGKAMTSGMVPMSGAVIKAELGQYVRGPAFDSTFGWTPLACAAAAATLDVLARERLCERATMLGHESLRRLNASLSGMPLVLDIRGRGLEIGIELSDESKRPLTGQLMNQLTQCLLRRGVFAEFSRYTSTLLVMPPLTIPEEQLSGALGVIAECIGEASTA